MRRSLGRRGNNMNSNHGPLMTEHLQDIDLELELLKRKREMIEQQQQLLVMEQQFKTSRHSYDPMRYDEPDQHGSNRDYNHMYDSGPKRNQFGRKRQPEHQWQYDGPPKKINPKKKPQFNQNGNPGPANVRNQRSNPGPPNQGPKYPYGQPAPLMDIKIKQSIGQKIANQKVIQQKKNFVPTKVTKSKAPSAPNKLASRSIAERKSLVAAATGAPSGDMTNMLLPNSVPSQQVSGRLELALGAIMKNVRAMIDRKPEHAVLLRTLQMQRVMKQAVRERIRNVMLGKVVGSLIDILAIYREAFPEETDLEILNLAIEAGGAVGQGTEQKPKSKFIEADDPGEFFKINMTALIESKLNEMFSKLENMVNEETPEADNADNLENSENLENKENGIKSEKPDGTDKPEQSDDPEKSDKPEESDKSEKTDQLENADNPENADNHENSDKAEKSDEPENSDKPEKPENTDNQIDLSEKANNTEKDEGQEYKDFLNMSVQVHQVRRVLPRLLKRFTPYIIKLINVDALYQSTKAAIIMRANEKAAKLTGTKLSDVPEPVIKSDSDAKEPVEQSAEAENRTMYNLPYYVKIMGRPSLPKRRTMQGFLNKFNPKSIKKHRTIHNLLFVGFSEKADFDAMVASDGTVMGRSTLSVRVCSKDNQNSTAEQNGENNDNMNDTDVSMAEIKTEENSADDMIISSDLENQISDLLSTIRKSEEDNENNTNNTDAELKNDAQQDENNPAETITKKEQDESDDNKAKEEQASDEIQVENNDEQKGQASDDTPKQDTESNNDSEAQDSVEKADETKVSQPENSAEGNSENSEGVETANSESNEAVKKMEVDDDKLGELKGATTGRSTPTRTSARLANVTPSTIRTRRASRLAQN